MKGKPAMIVAHTIKGKGCCVVEGIPASHNVKVSDKAEHEMYVNALERSRVFYEEAGYRVEFASDLYGARTDMELVSEMAAFFGE